jgi:hypothetical protein
MTLEEKKNRYPNLWKVAQELARCENPYKVLDALTAMIKAGEVEL